MSLPAPAYDHDLDKLFQSAVAGITGLDGSMVRPRYQPKPPKQPEPSVNWCAVGVSTLDTTGTPWIEQSDPPAPGQDPESIQEWEFERIEVFASFYGPNAAGLGGRLRAGIWIPQNMEALQANEIYLEDTGQLTRAPDLINQQWVSRYDFLMTFNRKIVREYPVGTFEVANIHLFDDHPPEKAFFDETILVETKPET